MNGCRNFSNRRRSALIYSCIFVFQQQKNQILTIGVTILMTVRKVRQSSLTLCLVSIAVALLMTFIANSFRVTRCCTSTTRPNAPTPSMRTGWKSDNVVGRSGVSDDEENTLFVATTGALISIGGVLAFAVKNCRTQISACTGRELTQRVTSRSQVSSFARRFRRNAVAKLHLNLRLQGNRAEKLAGKYLVIFARRRLKWL